MCQPSLSLTLVRCFLSPCVPWYITKDKMWIKNHETCSSITQAVTLFWKRVLLSRSQFYNFRVCEVVHLNGNIYYYGGVERNLLPLQHTYMWVREKNLHKLFSYAVTMTLCIYCTWKEAVLHAHMQNKTNNGHQIGSRMDEWKRIWIHVLNWWIVFPNCHP